MAVICGTVSVSRSDRRIGVATTILCSYYSYQISEKMKLHLNASCQAASKWSNLKYFLPTAPTDVPDTVIECISLS